ncbi:MAG: DUF6775 family putative metallopeptidase [Nitrososphaeraceae archaeon]
MLFCENINLYNVSSWSELNIHHILPYLSGLLPYNHLIHNTNGAIKIEQIEKEARNFESTSVIKDIKTPLHIYDIDYNHSLYRIEKSRTIESETPPIQFNNQSLYDGFIIQKILEKLQDKIIWQENFDRELALSTLNIIITDKLLCTFDETDWRYHARSLICGNPTLISTSGIVEGLAKPRDYYYKLYFFQDPNIIDELNKEYSNQYINYNDSRINDVIEGLILQSLFYFINSGDPFCKDRNCRFFNAHYHEDAIRTNLEKNICKNHTIILKKYNQNLFHYKNSHLNTEYLD